MPTIPYLRTQLEIKTDIGALVRDALVTTATDKWSAAEAYLAINQALMTWHDKVKLPYLYTITGGYVLGTNEYALPAYIRPPIYPEAYRLDPYYDNTATSYSSHWQELLGWDYVVDGSGAGALRVYQPRDLDGQLWFYAPNSRVPTTPTLPTTSGSTAADATSVVIGSVIDVDDVGYIKIDSEYMSYAGITRGTSTTTLLNVVRALNGSAAAVHNTATTVYWCVGADTMALFNLMSNQARAVLASMTLFDGSTHERSQYEKQMSYYQQLADEYWKVYRPDRPNTTIKLNRKAFALR